jgi:hypothetical protein
MKYPQITKDGSPRKKPSRKEDDIHKALVRYIRAQYPLWLFYHPGNGGKRDAKTGALMKALGVVAGTPDLCFCEPYLHGDGTIRHGFYMELKTDTGTLRASQNDFLEKLRFRGYGVAVAYSLDEAIEIVRILADGIERLKTRKSFA